jgi:hypothetical protein
MNLVVFPQMRKTLDKLSWKSLRLLFKQSYIKLKKLGIVQSYNYLGGYTLVSIDGVEHFRSEQIHCEHCLKTVHKSGKVDYHHCLLCAVMVHPEKSEVFVLGTEPIQQQDGSEKNDCERNVLNWFSAHYKGEKLLFIEDTLYATAPNVQQIQENNWDFMIGGVKPDGNAWLFQSFETRKANDALIEQYTCQDNGAIPVLLFS